MQDFCSNKRVRDQETQVGNSGNGKEETKMRDVLKEGVCQ